MDMVPLCTSHSRAVCPNESWYFTSPAVAWSDLTVMFKVDAPERISTPGQSTSGAEGVGDAGWLTPGLAPEKKLDTRALHDGVVDCVVWYWSTTLDADEQPDIRAAMMSAPARPGCPRLLFSPDICCSQSRLRKRFHPFFLLITAKPWQAQGRFASSARCGQAIGESSKCGKATDRLRAWRRAGGPARFRRCRDIGTQNPRA